MLWLTVGSSSTEIRNEVGHADMTWVQLQSFRDLCHWPASKCWSYILPIYNFHSCFPASYLLKLEWM